MRSDDLLDIIGEVDDGMIVAAKNNRRNRKSVWIRFGAVAASFVFVFAVGVIGIYSHERITEKEVKSKLEDNGISAESVKIEKNSFAEELERSLRFDCFDMRFDIVSGKIITLVITVEGEDKCSLNDHIMLARLYDIIYYNDYHKYADAVKIRVVNSNGKEIYSYLISGLGDFGKPEKNTAFDIGAATKELTDTLTAKFKDYGLTFEETAINETEYGNRVYIRISCSVNMAETVNEEVDGLVRIFFRDEASVNGITIELCDENGNTFSHMVANFDSGVTLGWMTPEVAAQYGPPTD